MSSSMIPYKLVPEGKGKSFIQDADRFPVIGTHGCITCVGVYFKINDESCFLAHISAVVMYGGKQPKWKRRACTPGEGARVKAAIQAKLEEAATKHFWDPADSNIRNSLLVICPRPENNPPKSGTDHMEHATGYYIIEAIRDFFNAQGLVALDRHGFAIDRRDGSTKLLSSDGEDAIWEKAEMEAGLDGTKKILSFEGNGAEWVEYDDDHRIEFEDWKVVVEQDEEEGKRFWDMP